jgi:PncC family amidohydrolase
LTPPEIALHSLLHAGSLTIGTAESCTGGLVAARLTSISGSSKYVQGGIVAYSNQAKADLLGVSTEILQKLGAVSEECAIAMAEGARVALKADVAVSTTGIAGPTGATERKPIGLVYVAVATSRGTQGRELHLTGDRRAITEAAAETALEALLTTVRGELAERTET